MTSNRYVTFSLTRDTKKRLQDAVNGYKPKYGVNISEVVSAALLALAASPDAEKYIIEGRRLNNVSTCEEKT